METTITIAHQQDVRQKPFGSKDNIAVQPGGLRRARSAVKGESIFLILFFIGLLNFVSLALAAPPIGPDGPVEPEPEIPEEYLPPTPPANIRVVARQAMSIELLWYDASQYEDGYELQRRVPSRNRRWDILSNWGTQTGTRSYVDTDVQPDTEYCYRLRVHNARGERFSPQKCVYSRDGNDYRIWRAQITFNTASRGNADTDDSVYVRLNAGNNNVIPSGNRTWLDYGRDDFERGDVFSYDLSLKSLGELSDITQIYISKLGNDGWCIRDFILTINGLDVYDEDFRSLENGCLWLDNDDGDTRTHVVTHDMLRAHPDWQSYNHSIALLLLAGNGIPNEEMVSRLEGMTGDFIHSKKLYWGHFHGPAVEVTRGCPADADFCQTIHVDFDLAASAPGPDPEVDVDFDLALECRDGDLSIASSNVVIDVDSSWFWEVLSLGLINFLDGEVEDRVENGWDSIEEMLEVGGDCRIDVNEDGDIFIEAVPSEQPVIVLPPQTPIFHRLSKAAAG